MPTSQTTIAAALLCSLISANAFAKSDFDNSDISPSGGSFRGGCATVVKFEPVDNVQPRYTDRYPDQNNVYTGGLIAGLLGAIPGVGPIAALAADLLTSAVGSAFAKGIDDAKAENAVKEKKWEKVYLLTVKPDFGPEYTVPYEKLNQRTPDPGDRVTLNADALNPNGWMNMRFSFIGGKDTGEVGSEKYLESCYASYGKAGKNPYKFRQLSYNGEEFEWKKLDPNVQVSADAYFSAKAEAKVNADEAEKHKESR